MMTPHLDPATLTDLTTRSHATGGELLRRVPRDLAAYYQAVPLAAEEGRVTVVTAHPDNQAGLDVMARLLGADVVPVAGSEPDVVTAIAHLYPTAAGEADVLQVCHLTDRAELGKLMRQTAASLLLVRGAPRAPSRVLVALRGYGSDHAALAQTRRLLARQPAAVTVLPLASGRAWQPDRFLATNAPARVHLLGCLTALGSLPVTVRLRPGDAAEQLIAELTQCPTDLLVIAAEAWGEFVLRALDRLEAAGVLSDQPILIVRPPVLAGHPMMEAP